MWICMQIVNYVDGLSQNDDIFQNNKGKIKFKLYNLGVCNQLNLKFEEELKGEIYFFTVIFHPDNT